MKKNWDYALLSKRAKMLGGPNKLLAYYYEQGKLQGVKDAQAAIGSDTGVVAILKQLLELPIKLTK